MRFIGPRPSTEPIPTYLAGTKEQETLKAELARQFNQVVRIPLIIGGKEIVTDATVDAVMPHDHGHILAKCRIAGEKE